MATEQKTYELLAQPRSEKQAKAGKQLRKLQMVPGVVYGQGMESQSVIVPARDFDRVYHHAGSITLVNLRVGDNEMRKVFIHNVQRDPVTHHVRHVDFREVNLREEMTASIPLVLVGEAPGDAEDTILLSGIDHVQVRALPGDLPQMIEVDVSGLMEVDQALYVSDLQLPEGITLLTSAEDMVVKIAQLRVAAEDVEEEPEEGEGEAEGTGETEAEANAEGGDNAEIPEQTA
jgi:large subunit ribosomal protein L25